VNAETGSVGESSMTPILFEYWLKPYVLTTVLKYKKVCASDYWEGTQMSITPRICYWNKNSSMTLSEGHK
jgi:hypothetical protein